MEGCAHLQQIKDIKKAAKPECVDCVRMGSEWVHLRTCQSCGETRCCDSSPKRHATKHFHETQHAVMRSIMLGDTWDWCYVHEVMGRLG